MQVSSDKGTDNIYTLPVIKSTTKKTLHTKLLSTIVLTNILWLTACQPNVNMAGEQPSMPLAKPSEKIIEKIEKYDYLDSTLFFDEIHASLSMRATFKRSTFEKGADGLVENYKFQFRSRRDLPVKISNIAIIVAGKRIFLESGTSYLPKNKPLIFTLSTADSQFIQDQPQAIFLFEYQNDSKAVLIEGHKLVKFVTD